MTAYVALLRAVNVGGTGKLPMTDLRDLCESLGYIGVKTYIASGNVVFKSGKPESKVKAGLESALAKYAGKPVGVLVRTAAEMAEVFARNPFPEAPGNRTVAIFLDEPPPANAMENLKGQKDEQLHLGKREIYVFYGDGMGNSKLTIPAAKLGTARNMNTVATLAKMAAEL
ncbi:MAG: DUF1697 domain-containing protein [Luteolibacter sp.]|uniref:DUF1697 domain-containing protein n=1 Tax=Luteolibacter sp. TaxID=1962973 RepID=UPI0032632926